MAAKAAVKAGLAVLLVSVAGQPMRGQGTPEKLPAFDVISVKPSAPDAKSHSIFPIGPGDVYVKNGGHFSADGFPLATYLSFAFQLVGSEANAAVEQLPGWAVNDRFAIEARTDGDPAKDTKEQMRLMMRSLLAERFGLKTHYETRQVSIFAVTFVKAGKPGPQLQQHPEDAACDTVLTRAGAAAVSLTDTAGIYPKQCGGMLPMPASAPGRFRFGARNVTMDFIAKQLTSLGDLERPAVDQTGLEGTFDFVLEFVPDVSIREQGYPDYQPDPTGPTFSEAVREQLGLKLESTKAPSQVLVIDRVEHPTQN
ncbi:MAG TPA: TIGR03435 family protein [Bryobacteraceae bacterium]|nr:TIGR03435 family protein [Bryobacteraceae bacterium]